MKRSLLALFAITATLAGCSDDPAKPSDPAVDKAAVWKQLTFAYDTMYLEKSTPVIGLQTEVDNMVAVTPNFFATVNPGGQVTMIGSISPAPTRTALPFLNPDYMVYGGLRQQSSANGPRYLVISERPTGAHEYSIALSVPISALDATLSERAEFLDNPYNRKPLAVVNSAGQMLVRVFEQDPALPNPIFLYMLQLSHSPGSVDAQVVWRTEGHGFLLTLNDRFFSSTNFRTDEIHPDGTVTRLFDHMTRDMINYGGRMVASTYGDGILASADNGATWERISYETEASSLFEVDGKLCFLGNPSFLELREDDLYLDDGLLHATPLSRDGLPDGQFTAAVQFDYRVYLATSEGLFFKPVSHFFTKLHAD